jgi:hypothetical protein
MSSSSAKRNFTFRDKPKNKKHFRIWRQAEEYNKVACNRAKNTSTFGDKPRNTTKFRAKAQDTLNFGDKPKTVLPDVLL